MSYEVLKTIDERRGLIPANLKPALIGSVTQAQRNHAEITGRRRDAKFFYRETDTEDGRRSLFQRTSEMYFSVGLASGIGGDLIDREFASWSELRRRLQGISIDARGLFDVREETDALLNVFTSAAIRGSRIEARSALIKMRRNIDAMLMLCDVELPGFAGVL